MKPSASGPGGGRGIMRQGAIAILLGLVAFAGVSPVAGSGAATPAGARVPIRGHLAPTPALDGIDDLVVAELQRWAVPGVAIGARVDGRVMMARGYGWRDLERRLPVTPGTVFPVGSVTKPLTTTALGALVDDGLLDWDRPVREQLPDFQLADPEATARATLRDLLTHRLGLPRHDLFWYGAGLERDELVRRLRFLAPHRPFRGGFHYQNLGYVVAGHLAGHASASSWEEVLRKRLLTPLGMRDTSLSVAELGTADDVASPYADPRREPRRLAFRNVDAVAPALGVNSSVDDLLGFLALHLDGGKLDGMQLLSPETLRELHEPQVDMGPGNDGGGRHYTLGLVASHYAGHRLLSHEGGVDGFRALISLLPDDDAGVVVLANSSARHELVERLARELWHRLLGRTGRASDGPDGVTPSPAANAGPTDAGARWRDDPGFATTSRVAENLPLDGYTGNFEHPAYGTVGVRMRQGHLELVFHGLDLPLEAPAAGTSRVAEGHPFAGLPVWFGADRTGAVDRLAVPLEPAVAPIVFERVPSRWTREPGFLREFVGAYRLDGTVLRVELHGDVLRLDIPGADSFELVPLDRSTFEVRDLDGTTLVFRRDGAGNVMDMALQQTHATLVAQRR